MTRSASDGRLAREDLAHAPARDLGEAPLEPRVRAREVDVLEDAERVPRGLGHELRAHAPGAERDHLPRLDLAHELRADDVEGAALRGHAPALAEPSEGQRAHAVGVTEGQDALRGHHHRRERALEARHDLGERLLDARRLVNREQRGDDLRVRGGAEAHAAPAQLGVELDGVREVAVVGEGHLVAIRAVERLGVLPPVRAGGRVAHVADGHRADERPQLGLVEDLGHEAEVAQRGHVRRPGSWRCRPTPGRGAGGRRARSRRGGRRPCPARRRRRRRTRRAGRRERGAAGTPRRRRS